MFFSKAAKVAVHITFSSDYLDVPSGRQSCTNRSHFEASRRDDPQNPDVEELHSTCRKVFALYYIEQMGRIRDWISLNYLYALSNRLHRGRSERPNAPRRHCERTNDETPSRAAIKTHGLRVPSYRLGAPSLRAFRKAYALTWGITESRQRDCLSAIGRLSS